MSNVSLEAAINIAEKYLNEKIRNPYDSPKGDRWVVTENAYDHGEYWVLHYQSELYIKTGNPSYMLAGNLPLKLLKATGEIISFGKDKVKSRDSEP